MVAARARVGLFESALEGGRVDLAKSILEGGRAFEMARVRLCGGAKDASLVFSVLLGLAVLV